MNGFPKGFWNFLFGRFHQSSVHCTGRIKVFLRDKLEVEANIERFPEI